MFLTALFAPLFVLDALSQMVLQVLTRYQQAAALWAQMRLEFAFDYVRDCVSIGQAKVS